MRSRKYISLFMFLLIFSEWMGFRLWSAEEAGGARITGLYTLFSLAFSAVVGCLTGKLLSGAFAREGKGSRSKGSRSFAGEVPLNRTFLLLWAVLFICYIPCFLAFYPGLYNNDMSWQWFMYVTGQYNTHHPILHTVLSGSLFELGKILFGSYNAGLVINSILQLLVLSGSVAFALRYLIKTGSSRRAFALALLFYALYPYIPVMGISTTKDAIFGPLFLILFVCLCEMAQERKLYSGWRLAVFFGVLVLAGMFRNNAIYTYLLAALCLAFWALVKKLRGRDGRFLGKLSLLLGAGIVISQLGLMFLAGAFHAEKGKINEMFSVPCQQMARAYIYHGDEMSEGERERLFRFIPEEDLQNYNYYISDPVKNNLKDGEVKAAPVEFLKLWVKMGVKYPKEYVEAFLDNTFGIWYLTGDTGSNLPYDYREPVDETHYFTEESVLPALKDFYRWFHYTNYEKYLPLVSMIFYMPFFCWMTVFDGFAVLDKGRFSLFVLPLFLFCYIFTVALGPCVPVRYLFNILLSAPFLTAVVMKPAYRRTEKRAEN